MLFRDYNGDEMRVGLTDHPGAGVRFHIGDKTVFLDVATARNLGRELVNRTAFKHTFQTHTEGEL